MSKEEMIKKIKEAHQRYVEWWLPIDVECGSLIAPMSCHRFCETLLYIDGGFGGNSPVKNWWDEWMKDFRTLADKTKMKQQILTLIILHHKGLIDLNKYE